MEDLFGSLRSDVEAVFMQAPTVQLEALATKVEAMSPHLEELVSSLPECICSRRKLAALLTALNSYPIKPKVRPFKQPFVMLYTSRKNWVTSIPRTL